MGSLPQIDADHSETTEGSGGCRVVLEVASSAAITADPCERPLDKPPFG
jgi:hypothetical protein